MNTKTLLFVLAAVVLPAVCSADLILARGGKALYTIVERPDAARLEKDCIRDLKYHLDKITGGDFKIGKADSKRIFIGVPAPGDNKPLAKAERRFKTVNGDLYIYGESTDGAAWGIYDFLEKYCGCRWYTIFGDEKIPANADLSIPELDDSKIPSFRRFETASVGSGYKSAAFTDFLRRRRVHITADRIPGDDDYLLGFPLHTFCKYIPSGKVPQGKFVNNIGDAYKYFSDKKYFETNPEWFTMEADGKRTWIRQLCLSNRELRKEFIKNLEIVIKNEYKGGEAVIVIDMNDRPDYVCKCADCQLLVTKYKTEGGPLYDFLIEAGRYFGKKYPEITIRSLAYGCSLVPPNCDLPENVMMWYAPLSVLDFMKNYRTSSDKTALNNLQKQAKRSKAMWKWMYLSPFYRGHNTPTLIANIQRLVDNLRIYQENNIKAIMTEVGMGIDGYFGFQELRLFMVSAMKEDLSQDEKALVREFADHCYGKAADKFCAFLQELEELNADTTAVLRWINRNPMSLPYLTAENLIRWSQDFDEMERLAADNYGNLLHVKRARMVLDQAVLCKWETLKKADPATYTDARFAAERKRYTDNIKEIIAKLYDKKRFPATSANYWYRKGMKAIGTAPEIAPEPIRPLPPELAGIPAERIRRAPFRPADGSKAPADPEGAFGTSMPGKALKGKMTVSVLGDPSHSIPMRNHPLTIKLFRSRPHGKYHYYFLGTVPVSTEGIRTGLVITDKESTVITDGYSNGVVNADVYISIKYMPPDRIWLDEIVTVSKP